MLRKSFNLKIFWEMRPANPVFEFRYRPDNARGHWGRARHSRRANLVLFAPCRYNREGFYIALMKRLSTEGLPPRQKDLIEEMQERFIQASDTGAAPGESTIRRRICAVWQELQ